MAKIRERQSHFGSIQEVMVIHKDAAGKTRAFLAFSLQSIVENMGQF